MVRYTGPWDEAGVAAFLDDAVVPVRLAVRTPDGPLWMLSLWFVHREGSLWCATAADADVVSYVAADAGVAFEVSTNDPPYRGVRGNGVATVLPDGKHLLRDLLVRYLGGTDSPLARRLLDPDREEVRIRVDPRRVHSWDYTGRMRDAVAEAAGGDAGDAGAAEDGSGTEGRDEWERPPPGATVDPDGEADGGDERSGEADGGDERSGEADGGDGSEGYGGRGYGR
jgi:hypothetical protein